MAPSHELRGGGPGRIVPAPDEPAGVSPRPAPGRAAGTSSTAGTFAATVGPLARAAELELRLREEALRRERAEARAAHAESLAELAAARVALLESQAAASEDARATEAAEQRAVIAALRRGLADLGDELDELRALAAPDGRAPGASADEAADVARAVRPRTATDPSIRMGELARGARELLAGGRLEAADEVIRGLEDAAARLRAQAPPPAPEAREPG